MTVASMDGELYMWGKNTNGQLGLGKMVSEQVLGSVESMATEMQEMLSLLQRMSMEMANFTIRQDQLEASHEQAFKNQEQALQVLQEAVIDGKRQERDEETPIVTEAAMVLSIPNKVECLNGVTIKIISLGFEHSIAVTDKGETLSWGGGRSGRLGHGHQSSIFGLLKSDSEYTPRLIKELEGLKVKNAAAGMLHSLCISENGSVHFFGERANKKLGYSEASNNSVPSMVDELPYSEKAACGGYHTCVITGGRELYVWGTNENGCLGIGSTDVAHTPERVEGPFLRHSVSEVSCGWKHTAAISGGNVYTWGWGGSHGTFSVDGQSSGGQLGQGNDVDYIKPTKVNFHRHVKALEVSCGFNHTAAILEYS
ncbi:ultraviolet-B receptor UVR8 isoform X4 [Lycium barbarum]|uniref:ultraviolet-B receptor UVR8 isoform X4 n=1 Tax=Lycium barbarum TaxID=112863 RepID=UPI00293EAA09|nr:ultraviolet-B receptor UVR8 isoform X4 [Lycium barbarum]